MNIEVSPSAAFGAAGLDATGAFAGDAESFLRR
jgi:hypothetical protein